MSESELKPEVFGQLSIQLKGNGSGSIIRTPANNCYQHGDIVSLEAKAQSGSRFVRWSGDVTGTYFVKNLRIVSEKSISATFEKIPSFSLEIIKNGDGFGIVTRSPNLDEYIEGSVVTLMAQAEEGSMFNGWQGDASGLNTCCTLVINSAKSVTADFLKIDPLEKCIPYFLDHCDGTVTHIHSGLVWMRIAEGQTWSDGICNGEVNLLSYSEALKISRNFAGYKWRLPTILELKSLIQPELSLAIHDVAFPIKSMRYFWTDSRNNDGRPLTFSPRCGRGGLGRVEKEWRPVQLVRGEKIPSFSLNVIKNGDGFGTVTCSPDLDEYIEGSFVELTAHPADGSEFIGWSGDLENNRPARYISTRNISINTYFVENKSISATFEKIPSFSLNVIKNGDGFGTVTCSPDLDEYIEGSLVKLTARPFDGSKFIGWSGDITANNFLYQIDLCSDYVVTMNAERSITAEFVQQKLFELNVTTTGTGSGTFTQSPDLDEYLEGSTVTLIAKAEEGSMFNGWQGDASGLDTCCTLAMDSAKSVTADFLKLDVPDLGIVVQFDSVEDANMQSGDEALILYFSIANNGQKQVCVELPLASYVTNHGEEIEQSVWLSSCLLGSKSSTLRAGTFRKMGLVFHKSRLAQVALGDDLHVTVFQAKPERRLSFTFRCIHKEPRQFILIKAVAELTQALDQDGEVSFEKLEILQRLTLLEEGMRDILRRLDALQFAPVTLPEPVNKNILPEPTRTLPEVLSWLATQDRISMATLRGQLLPLDLLPSAVIDDVNERAYDLAGEAALEDDGDAVLVQRDVLLQVLAAWDD